MHVVGHECIAERFDGENAGQFFEATADPFTAVRIIATGPAITPAKVIATDAAADDVEDLDIGFRKDFAAIDTWHDKPFQTATAAV
jgi:hypothetical protein